MRRPSTPCSSAPRVGCAGRSRAGRIAGIVPLHRVVGERQVARRRANGPEMVEAVAEREGAAARQAAVGRLEPEQPQNDDGTRIEPLVSEPRASGTMPAATAVPQPPDEPPLMRRGSCGLRDGPSWTFSPVKS